MVEPGGELGAAPIGGGDDRQDAHHVAEHGQGYARGEKERPPAPSGLGEIAVGGRKRHQRKDAPEARTGRGHVDGESAGGRSEHGALTYDIGAHPLEDRECRTGGEQPQMHRNHIEERIERNAKEEECAREHGRLGRAPAPEQERKRPHDADEAHDFESQLRPANADKAQEQRRQQQQNRRPTSPAGHEPGAFAPQDVERKQRHEVAVAQILFRRAERPQGMRRKHEPETPPQAS